MTIKTLLGHKSLESTTIYVHLAVSGKHTATSPFDSLMGGDGHERFKIQQVWNCSYADFSEHHIQSQEQLKTSHAIQNCKTGMLGATISQCTDCGHIKYHNNSCRNRNCTNCQAVKKELWVDKRRAEVIDSPYFICCPFGSRATASFHTFTQRYIYQLFGICCFPSFQSIILSHPGTVPDREWIEPPNRPGQKYNLLYKR